MSPVQRVVRRYRAYLDDPSPGMGYWSIRYVRQDRQPATANGFHVGRGAHHG